MINTTERKLLREAERKIDNLITYQQNTHRNHIIGVLLYVLIGVMWITFSDQVATSMFDGEKLLMVSQYKGYAFVAVTALIVAIFMFNMVKFSKLKPATRDRTSPGRSSGQ